MIPGRRGVILIVLLMTVTFIHAQDSVSAGTKAVKPAKKHVSMKDSLDMAFDLSNYIIESNGFVPIPDIITEPSLGGFGGALIPVFIKKRRPYVDSIHGKRVFTPIPPDITGGGGAYTANNTWMLAAFRGGTWVKPRIRYRIGGAYANVNMSFYHTFPHIGEKKFDFNFKAVPIFLQATKRIAYSKWYIGLKYLFMKTDLHYSDSLPSFVHPKDVNSITSQLGGLVELDTRDNVFTPNDGVKLHFDGLCSNQILGSDYDYWQLDYYMFAYKSLWKKLTLGLRVDGQQALGDVPFYLLPFINMRGVPANRYQGKATILTELETRWDFVQRWSGVFFGGTGKGFDDWADFGSAKWVVSYGAGFRYLLARKFGLRMGIDVAHSTGTWAYYIIFGSNWQR